MNRILSVVKQAALFYWEIFTSMAMAAAIALVIYFSFTSIWFFIGFMICFFTFLYYTR